MQLSVPIRRFFAVDCSQYTVLYWIENNLLFEWYLMGDVRNWADRGCPVDIPFAKVAYFPEIIRTYRGRPIDVNLRICLDYEKCFKLSAPEKKIVNLSILCLYLAAQGTPAAAVWDAEMGHWIQSRVVGQRLISIPEAAAVFREFQWDRGAAFLDEGAGFWELLCACGLVDQAAEALKNLSPAMFTEIATALYDVMPRQTVQYIEEHIGDDVFISDLKGFDDRFCPIFCNAAISCEPVNCAVCDRIYRRWGSQFFSLINSIFSRTNNERILQIGRTVVRESRSSQLHADDCGNSKRDLDRLKKSMVDHDTQLAQFAENLLDSLCFDIADYLDWLRPDIPISAIQRNVHRSVSKRHTAALNHNENIKASVASLRRMREDLDAATTDPIVVGQSRACDKCRILLMADSAMIFPCGHAFHEKCHAGCRCAICGMRGDGTDDDLKQWLQFMGSPFVSSSREWDL
jgi:hypothetical protein